MGGDLPKQYLPIGGLPILIRTIRAFLDADAATRIILVLPQEHQDYWRQLCLQHGAATLPHTVVEGGQTRFHSVLNGLRMVPDSDDAVVAVHDGVRPFVTRDTILGCYETAARLGSAVPVTPVVETMRHLLPSDGSQTVPRDVYRLVQTPQTFRASWLHKAYSQTYRPDFTDDASVVESLGLPIHLVPGDRRNIKITTPEDLDFANYLCQR